MKLTKKQDYIILIFAGLLIIVFVLITLILTFNELGVGGKRPAPLTQQSTQTKPRVKYQGGSLGKALARLTTRVPLSPSDQEIKQRLISQFPNGQINRTGMYSLEYVEGMNDFEVEILTTNVEQAKKEAENYLRGKGFSQDALCNLPVRFYLNSSVAKQIPKDFIFNPLAESC